MLSAYSEIQHPLAGAQPAQHRIASVGLGAAAAAGMAFTPEARGRARRRRIPAPTARRSPKSRPLALSAAAARITRTPKIKRCSGGADDHGGGARTDELPPAAHRAAAGPEHGAGGAVCAGHVAVGARLEFSGQRH